MIDDEDQNETPTDNDVETPMLDTHSVSTIEREAASLCADDPEQDLQKWLQLSSILVARARDIRHVVEKATISWIKEHGPLVVGDIQFTVGTRRYVRCLDAERGTQLVLDATGGDLHTFAQYLCANPFRYGSVRDLIGETKFAEAFVTEVRSKLIAGVHKPELIQTNLRYLPKMKARRHVDRGE